MNDNSSGVPDAGTSDEPALTQRNSATVHGEEHLSVKASGGESSQGGSSGAAPTYGPAGNTTDAEDEGADGHGI